MDIFKLLDVLVLDGDPLFCVWMEETLRMIGFEKIDAVSLPALGTSLLKRQRPAVIILDVENNREEVWHILSEPHHRGTLIVAMAFGRSPRARLAAIRQGADAFLPKPFTKSKLLETMSRLIAGDMGRRCKIVDLQEHRRSKSGGTAKQRREPGARDLDFGGPDPS